MLFVTSVLLSIGQIGGEMPNVQELEGKIRTRRESIRHGTMQIKSESYWHKGGRKILNENATRLIWFDSNRKRLTWKGKNSRTLDADKMRVACVPFNTRNDSLYYDDIMPSPAGQRITIHWQHKNGYYNHLLIDPRALGLHPMPMSAYPNYRLEKLLGRTNFKGEVRPAKYKNKLAYEITYRSLEQRLQRYNTTIRMIVVPALDYSVTEVELTAVYDKSGPSRQFLRIEPRQYGKIRRWYPGMLHFQKYSKDQLIEEDHSEVLSADFDTPPADVDFRLPAMNIPAGTPVDINSDGKSREWDGKKIIEKLPDAKKLSQQYPDLPPAGRTSWSSGWIWTSGGLMLVGAACLYGAWRWRKRAA